jgi:hypothetical protein
MPDVSMLHLAQIDPDTLAEFARTSLLVFRSISHLFMISQGAYPFPRPLGMDERFVQGTRDMIGSTLRTVTEKNCTILEQIREVNPSYGSGTID